MKSFCYLGDRLNASSSGSEAAVTARTKTRWIKFRECGEFLQERKFSLKIKREISQSYVVVVIQFPSGVVPSAEMAGFTQCMGIYCSEIFLQGACPCLPPTSVF